MAGIKPAIDVGFSWSYVEIRKERYAWLSCCYRYFMVVCVLLYNICIGTEQLDMHLFCNAIHVVFIGHYSLSLWNTTNIVKGCRLSKNL